MDTDELRAVKRRLSPGILAVRGVSGVGISSGRLVIYLKKDLPALRLKLERLLAHEAPDTPFGFQTTGGFRKH
jgi:hypothetical protein